MSLYGLVRSFMVLYGLQWSYAAMHNFCACFLQFVFSYPIVFSEFQYHFSTLSQSFLIGLSILSQSFVALSRLIKTSTTLSNLNLSHVISYLLFFTQRFFKENERFIIHLFLGYVKVGMGSKKVESFYLREIVLVSELAR